MPDGKRRREVNNDIDGVSGRGGEPDTAMAGRPGRVVVDRNADTLVTAGSPPQGGWGSNPFR
jgi:hypothetical protein